MMAHNGRISKVLAAILILAVALAFSVFQTESTYAATKATKSIKVGKTYLKSIKTSKGTIEKVGKNSYKVTVPANVSSTKITFTEANAKNKLKFKNGKKWSKWSKKKAVSTTAKKLKAGKTVIVKTTVKKGKKAITYTGEIYREEAAPQDAPIVIPDPIPPDPVPTEHDLVYWNPDALEGQGNFQVDIDKWKGLPGWQERWMICYRPPIEYQPEEYAGQWSKLVFDSSTGVALVNLGEKYPSGTPISFKILDGPHTDSPIVGSEWVVIRS
jgi:hypothetical protein